MNNKTTTQISVRISTDALNSIEKKGKELDRSRNYLINKTLIEKFCHPLVTNQ